MKDSPSLLAAVSAVCSSGTHTRSITSSGKLIFVIFCFNDKRHFRFLLALRNLMQLTISCNSSNVGSEEKSLCLYVHASNLLASKGWR